LAKIRRVSILNYDPVSEMYSDSSWQNR